jgi:hypothetical protein
MVGFLKKLKSLVGADGKSAPAAAAQAPAASNPPSVPVGETAPPVVPSAPREQIKAPKQEKETAAAAKAGIVAPRSAGNAPMPAAASATSAAPAVTKRSRPLDMNRIDLGDAWEVQYRRKQFGCTELQLKQAVAAVGDSVDKVKLHLRKRSVPPKGGKQRFE